MNNEEPKQIKCYCGHTIMCDCSPIEEAKQGLNLPLLEQKLDEALSNETEESLNTWLKEKRDKQETLEEAAEKYGNNIGNKNGTAQFDFIQCAKWQQEKSYSEEEVRNLFRNYQYDSAQFAAIMEGDTDGKPTPSGWFEQFKKK